MPIKKALSKKAVKKTAPKKVSGNGEKKATKRTQSTGPRAKAHGAKKARSAARRAR